MMSEIVIKTIYSQSFIWGFPHRRGIPSFLGALHRIFDIEIGLGIGWVIQIEVDKI